MSNENALKDDSDSFLQNYLRTRQVYCEKPLSVLVDGFQYVARHRKWLQKKWSDNTSDEECNPESGDHHSSGSCAVEQAQTPIQILYFLSHFHSDHYTGITRGWKHGLIYASCQTTALLQTNFGVAASQLCALSVEKEHLFSLPNGDYLGECNADADGRLDRGANSAVFSIFLIPANHCPGAVMFVFKSRCFGTIIHTGDFRFNGSEAAWRAAAFPPVSFPSSSGTAIETTPNHLLQRNNVKPPFYEQYIEDNACLQAVRGTVETLFLDNTFCDPSFSFSSQYSVTQHAVETLRELLVRKAHLLRAAPTRGSTESNGSNKDLHEVHCVVLVGTYTIGKERVAFAIQEHFPPLETSIVGRQAKSSVPIYVTERKYSLFKAMSYHEEHFSAVHGADPCLETRETTPVELPIGGSSLPDGSEDTDQEEELVLVRPLEHEICPPIEFLPRARQPFPLPEQMCTLPESQAPSLKEEHCEQPISGSVVRYFLSIFLVPFGTVSYQALARACGRPIKQSHPSGVKRKRNAPIGKKVRNSSLLSIGEGLGIDLASYNTVLAVDPSGWNKKSRLHRVHEDRVWMLKIPYSEHCSFPELLNFVKLVNPHRVVPTVSLQQYRAQESLFVEKAPHLSTRFSNTQPLSRFFRQNSSAVGQGSDNLTPTHKSLTKPKVEKEDKAKQSTLIGHFSVLKPLVSTLKKQYSKLVNRATCVHRPRILDDFTACKRVDPLKRVLEQEGSSHNKGDSCTKNANENLTNKNCELIIVDTSEEDDDGSVEEIVQCSQKVRV